MMNLSTKKLFEILFQEAHVIDFDFSCWDKKISLVVIGGLYEKNFFNKAEWIHQVFFENVQTINWTSRIQDKNILPEEKHCQWVIMDFKISNGVKYFSIILDGVSVTSPCLEIVCQNVHIQEMHISVLKNINPKWMKQTHAPLARPGIVELEKIMREKN